MYLKLLKMLSNCYYFLEEELPYLYLILIPHLIICKNQFLFVKIIFFSLKFISLLCGLSNDKVELFTRKYLDILGLNRNST